MLIRICIELLRSRELAALAFCTMSLTKLQIKRLSDVYLASHKVGKINIKMSHLQLASEVSNRRPEISASISKNQF